MLSSPCGLDGAVAVGQCNGGRSLNIAAETIRYDFDESNLSAGNSRHFAVVLPEVVAGLDLVHEAVLGLDEPIKAIAHLEGADHSESVERKPFETFAVPPRTRTKACLAVSRPRALSLAERWHP